MTRMLDIPGRELRAAATPHDPSRLRAVAILAASPRRSLPLARLSRPIPDLPIVPGRTLAEWTLERLLGRLPGDPACALLAGAQTPGAIRSRTPAGRPIEVVPDRARHRGTAGSLRDFSQAFDPDDLLLAVVGSEFIGVELAGLVEAMLALGSDIVLPRLACGAPIGVWLIRAGAISDVPPVGFADFKEQTLPALASRFDVRVCTLPGDAPSEAISVRSREEYIRALRLAAGGADEPWKPTFALAEEGAEVHPEAVIHDSVILAGARVERGAIVARSVVDAGVTVRAHERILDRVVGVQEREGARR